MKILCDVHLPKRLVSFLIKEGIEAIHGSSILDGWTTKDHDFSIYADENEFIFVTKDADFRDSHFLNGSPRKLIKIDLGNISNDELISIFGMNLKLFQKVFTNNIAYVEISRYSVRSLIR